MKMKELSIIPYIWNEENLRRYRESLKEQKETPMSHYLFYIDPKGSLMQHQMLLALSVNYAFRNVQEDVLVKELLREEPVLWKMEFMSETEPGSGEFRRGTCDLLEKILQRKDVSLLRRLYHVIPPERREEVDALLKEVEG